VTLPHGEQEGRGRVRARATLAVHRFLLDPIAGPGRCGRRARRETSKLVAPGIIRRKSSSKDRRLKKLFNGERGLPFKKTEELPG
jgi:hypothetical protein